MCEIRNKIEGARVSVNQGMDGHKTFDFVYDYMVFSQKIGLLKRESLDILWNELRDATCDD